MELMQFFGARDITLDIYQHSGNDPINEPWVVDCLRDVRPRLDALASLNLRRRVERGVHLWTHPRAARFQQTESSARWLMDLWPNFQAWGNVCARVGVASTFETRGGLTLVSGDAIRAAGRQEILRLLRGGLFLDGRAALALQEMGYGRHLGIEIKKRIRIPRQMSASLEVVLDDAFGLAGSRYMMSLPMGNGPASAHAIYISRLRGARMVSEIQSADFKPITPCLTLHENGLGGRIATFAYDFDSGVTDAGSGKTPRFYNYIRKRQILAALHWLNRGHPILHTPDPAPFILESCVVGGQELLAVVNISGDAVKSLRLESPALPRGRVEMLDEKGRWKVFKNGMRALSVCQAMVDFSRDLQPFQNAFLRWKRKPTRH
jgi:hypothetical protein